MTYMQLESFIESLRVEMFSCRLETDVPAFQAAPKHK